MEREGRMMAAKRSREEKQMELDDLQEGVTAGNEAKTIQNVNDNYEIVKANTLANEELLTKKKAEQDKRINSTRDVLVELDQKLNRIALKMQNNDWLLHRVCQQHKQNTWRVSIHQM